MEIHRELQECDFDLGSDVYIINNISTKQDCPVCGGRGTILGLDNTQWICPSPKCDSGKIIAKSNKVLRVKVIGYSVSSGWGYTCGELKIELAVDGVIYNRPLSNIWTSYDRAVSNKK